MSGMRRLALICLFFFGVAASAAHPGQYGTGQQSAPQNIFHVKYISEGSVYLDAGRNAGLEEGMILHLIHADPNGGTTESVRFQGVEPVADVRIFSVADSSSAAEIVKSREDSVVGDIAYLDVQSIQARGEKINQVDSENYPVVVTFSYGDPLDEEIRATTVSEKTGTNPENQIRGRFGLDAGYVAEPGGVNSRQVGMLIDADISRIAGTHWNFTGYWRGDLTTQSTGNQGGVPPVTLSDLLNRTYHLGLYYQNPRLGGHDGRGARLSSLCAEPQHD